MRDIRYIAERNSRFGEHEISQDRTDGETFIDFPLVTK